MRPIDPGVDIRNDLMAPRQPSHAPCSITRDHLIVDINSYHISATPAAVDVDHGSRSHPGVHQLLDVSPGFLARQQLGKSPSTARLASGVHPSPGLNGHENVALIAGFLAPKCSRIQLNDTIAHLVACNSVLEGRPNLLQHAPHAAVRFQTLMPQDLLCGYPACTLHDIKQRVDQSCGAIFKDSKMVTARIQNCRRQPLRMRTPGRVARA